MKTTLTAPGHEPEDKSLEGKIRNGQPGQSMIHKVGSAKQYATKGCGRVCNQAKFPTSKGGPRKKD